MGTITKIKYLQGVAFLKNMPPSPCPGAHGLSVAEISDVAPGVPLHSQPHHPLPNMSIFLLPRDITSHGQEDHLGGPVVKNLPDSARDMGLILGLERFQML